MRFGDERSPRSCGAGAEIGSLRQARALRLCTIREQKKSAPRTVHAAPDAYGYCEGLPGQQTFLQGPGRQDASRRGAPRPGLGRPRRRTTSPCYPGCAAPGRHAGGGSIGRYAAARGECCVCAAARADAVAEPCGHISCCAACLEALRARRDGCPICRQRIRAIARAAPRAPDPGAPGAPDPVPHAGVLAVAPPRAPALSAEAPPAEVLAVAPPRAPALSEAPPAA